MGDSDRGREGEKLNLGNFEYEVMNKLNKKENERRVREILSPYFNRDIFMDDEMPQAFENIKELKEIGEKELYNVAYDHLKSVSGE